MNAKQVEVRKKYAHEVRTIITHICAVFIHTIYLTSTMTATNIKAYFCKKPNIATAVAVPSFLSVEGVGDKVRPYDIFWKCELKIRRTCDAVL